MKPIALFCLTVAVVLAASEEEKKEEPERPKTFRRLIPADVLRGEFSATILTLFTHGSRPNVIILGMYHFSSFVSSSFCYFFFFFVTH